MALVRLFGKLRFKAARTTLVGITGLYIIHIPTATYDLVCITDRRHM